MLRYELTGEPTVREVNPAFEAAFDLDASTVVGERLAGVFSGDQVERNDDGDAGASSEHDGLLESIRAGEQAEAVIRRETPRGIRHFLVRDSPVADGANPGGYLLFTDLTDYRREIQDLETKVERLEESTHVIAHDIRNPLEVAKINLDVAQETGDDELLEEVEAAHDHIERIIDDVLTLAARGLVIDGRHPTDLEAVVHRAWGSVDTAEASLAVEGSLVLEADADRLQQLLENLIRNAIEHGGESVRVLVGPLPDQAGFYVADDGPGIPEEQRERVFDQGYSLDEGGSGFGLAIVNRIADAHGWAVRLTASRAGGARFEFVESPGNIENG